MNNDILLTGRHQLERLCAVAAHLCPNQLPLFRAAADGSLALLQIADTSTVWPERLVRDNRRRPLCILIGADPGVGYHDPAPAEWACAARLKAWCQTGGAIVHGADGAPEHYRQAAIATATLRRLAFIETTSRRALEWVRYLACPRTLLIRATDGIHPNAGPQETVQ